MRLSSCIPAIVACAVLAFAQAALAAASCPGGGTPTNCKAHCTLTNPPQCTEECECAITKFHGLGVNAPAAAAQTPVQNKSPVSINTTSPQGGTRIKH